MCFSFKFDRSLKANTDPILTSMSRQKQHTVPQNVTSVGDIMIQKKRVSVFVDLLLVTVGEKN